LFFRWRIALAKQKIALKNNGTAVLVTASFLRMMRRQDRLSKRIGLE
jgi:hypothetical protein